jgi:hypothetical protein
MNKFYLFFLVLIFSSCTTSIRYIGQSFPETDHVDVFINESSIKRPFDYIGKGFLGYFKNPVKIQQKSEKLARKKGADAVLILDYYIPDNGTLVNTVFRTDSVNRAAVTTSSTTIQPIGYKEFYIYFLKYQK